MVESMQPVDDNVSGIIQFHNSLSTIILLYGKLHIESFSTVNGLVTFFFSGYRYGRLGVGVSACWGDDMLLVCTDVRNPPASHTGSQTGVCK